MQIRVVFAFKESLCAHLDAPIHPPVHTQTRGEMRHSRDRCPGCLPTTTLAVSWAVREWPAGPPSTVSLRLRPADGSGDDATVMELRPGPSFEAQRLQPSPLVVAGGWTASFPQALTEGPGGSRRPPGPARPHGAVVAHSGPGADHRGCIPSVDRPWAGLVPVRTRHDSRSEHRPWAFFAVRTICPGGSVGTMEGMPM